MTACGGNECGSGTTEKDGQCVPTSTLTCGDGTVLEDGKCVPTSTLTCGDGTMLADGKCVPTNTTTCGAGTMLADGKCVPTSTTECGAGTMLVNGQCVPTSTLTCGAGTMPVNGQCVPTSTLACGAGTVENNGNCVVAMAACGAGTQLDANAGTCVVTNMVCGAGTAFTNNTCLPTASVCATGTTFNDMTGTCLPDATCQVGDVVLGGVCVRPVQQLLAGATVNETENNDPTRGGTAQALTIPAAGTQLVVAGSIGVPTDLDADMVADQDLDGFTVTLAAGDLIQVAVQPVAGPSLGFIVLGPNGTNYTRSSTLGLTQGAARQIFAPVAGEYTIIVGPAVDLLGKGGPVGNADWTYALTVEQLAAPTATSVDVTMGNVTADLINLHDNLFKITGHQAGALLKFKVESLGADADGVMYIGNALGNMTRSVNLTPSTVGTITLTAGDNFVFFDWFESQGPANNVEVSFTPPPSLGPVSATPVTSMPIAAMPVGASQLYTFTATAGDVLRIRQNNNEGNSLGFTVTPNGPGQAFVVGPTTTFPVSVLSSAVNSPSPTYAHVYIPADGTYTLEVDNRSGFSTRNNVTFTLDTLTPGNFGSLNVGSNLMGSTPFSNGTRVYNRVSFTERLSLSGTVTRQGSLGDFAVSLYALASAARVFNADTLGASETISGTYAAGDYLFELRPTATATGASYNINAVAPPVPPEFENTTPLPIPDNNATGVTSTLVVNEPGCNIASIKVFVNVTHTYKGDVTLRLTSPDGTSVLLHNKTGGSADDIIEIYPDTVAPAQSLDAFNGKAASGTWTLFANDTFAGDVGTVNSWGITTTCLPS
jgi:subtilisin-like proprotein convertase family protein